MLQRELSTSIGRIEDIWFHHLGDINMKEPRLVGERLIPIRQRNSSSFTNHYTTLHLAQGLATFLTFTVTWSSAGYETPLCCQVYDR
jgi:hypothetical protein